MAAELHITPARATDSSGRIYPGARWEFYVSGTSTPQAVYADADLAVSLGVTVSADSGGKFVPIYFDAALAYRGVLKDLDGAVTIYDIDPINNNTIAEFLEELQPILAASIPARASRALLAAISNPQDGQGAMLTEAGREGLFYFDSSNLSAEVTADTGQGVYVPPSSDTDGSSGAWVRVVDDGVRPEWFGAARDDSTDDTAALRLAFTIADLTSGEVKLTSGTCRYSSYMVVPVGVNVRGPRDAILKPIDQVSSLLTAVSASGTGAITVTVADTSAFVPGRNVIIAHVAAHAVSPSDSYNHRGRQVSSRSTTSGAGTVTLAAGPTMSAGAIGDALALSTMGLVGLGDNVFEGFTIDGNASSHTYGHWITSSPLIGEGDNIRRVGLKIQNTPSDAILHGGPSGGEIVGAYENGVEFENIGGNGFHYGNCRGVRIIGCEGYLGNVRFNLPVEQAGGASSRLGHQDGFICLSNDVADVKVSGSTANNWICGVGAIGTTVVATVQENDDVVVTGNTFIDCFRPLEAIQTAKRLVFSANNCRAQYPFNSGTHRWATQQIFVSGDGVDGFAQNFAIGTNVITNGHVYLNQVRNGTVTGNAIDNRQLNATAAALLQNADGIALFNFSGLTVTGNTVNGGYTNLYLQNSFATASNLCRDTVISGNSFLNAYLRCVSGTLGSTGTMDIDFTDNIVGARMGDTRADGVTPLTFETTGNWRCVTIQSGMRTEGNRVTFDVTSGQAWAINHTISGAARWNNMVNGVRELPANAVDDAAATAANIPVGGRYRNGSVAMVRAA